MLRKAFRTSHREIADLLMEKKMANPKNRVEIILMPLVVACVGILGTLFITQQQERNSLAKADSDRQVKILEIFAEKVKSPDEGQRLLSLKLLRAVDDGLRYLRKSE